MAFGSALERTPLGCRLVFFFAVACYGLFVFDHHDFISFDLTCKPADVIQGLQVQRLLLASFTHTSLPGLCLAIGVSWRRFSWIEHQNGTVGFLIWFTLVSLLLHGTYCVFAVFADAVLGTGLTGTEVHGLFPILIASLVAGMRESDNSEVWLWPLPFHVSVRAFPVVIIGLTWIFHMHAHFDVAVAYAVAAVVPEAVEPKPDVFGLEQGGVGQWLLSVLGGSEAFVCRTTLVSGPGETACAAPESSTQADGGLWGLLSVDDEVRVIEHAPAKEHFGDVEEKDWA